MLHKFTFNGHNILLDVESGAIHLLDEASYAIIGASDPYALGYDKQTVDEVLSELDELRAAGELDSKAPEVDRVYDLPAPIKSMCLHVAHDCNLRCKYCFADTGEFYGKRMLMTEDVAHAALDFLFSHSGKRHNLEIDLFGGEPLMNMPVVKEIVRYGNALAEKYNKHVNFTMTTNGVLLTDEISDWLNENMFNIVISIDGRREVHEAMRPTVGGQSSYDKTLENAKKLISKRGNKEYYIRGTYTCKNLDFAEDVFALYREGFKHISIEPVVLAKSDPLALREDHIAAIFKEYERLAALILEDERAGGDLHFFHYSIDLSHGPCLKRRIKGCGAGVEYVAVAPTGDIYPCHQFVGDNDFIVGNVTENTFDYDTQKEFAACSVLTKDACKGCFAKYFCSGGCAANAYHYNGSIYKPHELTCELLRKRTECAIGMFVERKQGGSTERS